jgi:hypothetical protein
MASHTLPALHETDIPFDLRLSLKLEQEPLDVGRSGFHRVPEGCRSGQQVILHATLTVVLYIQGLHFPTPNPLYRKRGEGSN